MFADMYQVFNNEKVYIGNVREGWLSIAIRVNNNEVELFEDGCCDCVGQFIKMINDSRIKYQFDRNPTPFLQTLRTVWEIHKEDYQFSKCWNCIYPEETLDCYSNGFEDITFTPEIMSWGRFRMTHTLNTSPLSEDEKFLCVPLDNLKDFDMESFERKVHFRCYVSKVYKPKLIDGDLHQKIIICDDNTKKTICCELLHSDADYDKWKKGQKIELIGEYSRLTGLIKVSHCRLLEENQKRSNENKSIRSTVEYNNWRDKVLEVGECYICGRKNKLQAHHINSVAEFPEQALDETNGVCLCKAHHDIYHEDFSNTGDAKSFMDFVSQYKRSNVNEV